MNTKDTETVRELLATAKANGLNYKFSKDGRVWVAADSRGRQLWAGTLRDVRRVAAGKLP